MKAEAYSRDEVLFALLGSNSDIGRGCIARRLASDFSSEADMNGRGRDPLIAAGLVLLGLLWIWFVRSFE